MLPGLQQIGNVHGQYVHSPLRKGSGVRSETVVVPSAGVVLATGRALAMDRVGYLELLSAEGSADGGAAGRGSFGEFVLTWPKLLGRVPVEVSDAPGTAEVWLGAHDASGSADAVSSIRELRIEDVAGVGSVPGYASGTAHDSDIPIDTSEFDLAVTKPHRLGSSGAGASFVTMVRAHPAHPVTEYDSQGPTNSDVVSVSPVAWLDAMASNSGSSTLYIMFFDATSVPANGTLPVRQPLELATGGQSYIDIGNPGADGISGRPTNNGLCWAASTTPLTLTVDSTSSIWVTARTFAIGT